MTEIEDWLRDPYTIYAKRILKLDALDPVDMPLSAADRGSAIHAAIARHQADFHMRIADHCLVRRDDDIAHQSDCRAQPGRCALSCTARASASRTD